MQQYFITGTDTDVGKTVVAAALLRYFNRQGFTTLGFKPISAGCDKTANGLRNEDALMLQQHSSIKADYDVVNPIAFEPPIAPHIAADLVNQSIDFAKLDKGYEQVKQLQPDVAIVEGAGGWMLPINSQQLLSEWVIGQQLEVILVVGIKLGCLNHALLTQAAIKASGLTLVGWVANIVAPESLNIEQNIQTLERSIDAPCLARIEFDSEHENNDYQFVF